MKVTPQLVLYCAAAQVVLTTIGFILYKRPYLWAWEALEYYSSVVCGAKLHEANLRYQALEGRHKGRIQSELQRYRTSCHEEYLESFSDSFYKMCMTNTKSAFVSIPIVSSVLIIGIVLCLHWAPFHKRTLKKPGFMVAFFLSLVLVAVNLGQIITIIVPLINEDASPDHNYHSQTPTRMKCGYGAELTALFLVLTTSILSSLIAYFIIKLYIIRIKGQEENLKKGNLRMETLEEYEQLKMMKKQVKKQKKKEKQLYQSALSSVHEDCSDDEDEFHQAAHQGMAAGMPVAGGQMPLPGGNVPSSKKQGLTRQDSGWGHSTPQRGAKY